MARTISNPCNLTNFCQARLVVAALTVASVGSGLTSLNNGCYSTAEKFADATSLHF
eukprot:COSAG02_NODE_55800_length_288_cov_1.100529_1_plen_55_part_10